MATRLRKLKITRVDRVPAGANPLAEVVLFKSKAPAPLPETKEPAVADDLKKNLDEITAERDALQAEIDALAGLSNEDLAALKGFEIAKSDTEDEVLKGLSPEVRERIEKAEAAQADANERIAKMEHANRVADFTKQAADLDQIAAADDLGPMLEELDRVAPEVAKSLTPVLKAANARIAEGALYAEFGKSDVSAPEAQIETRAAEIRKENPDVSLADALVRARGENPEASREAFYADKK